jgi:hypothetical protein
MKIAVIGREGRVFPQCEEIAQVAIVDVDPVSRSVQQTAFLTPRRYPGRRLTGCAASVSLVDQWHLRAHRELPNRRAFRSSRACPSGWPVIANFLPHAPNWGQRLRNWQ